MKNRITIGYPTYNRFNTIDKRIEELSQHPLFGNFNFLVIDNDSEDGTFYKLKAKYDYLNLEIVKNEKNVGLGMNIVRVLEKAKTEYIAIYSDEDFPNLIELDRLVSMYSPSGLDFLVGSVAAPNEKIKPTRICESGKCNIEQAHYTNYMSGILFSKSSVNLFIEIIKRVFFENEFVNLYPHRALVMALLPLGGGYSSSEFLALRREQKSSALPKMEVSSIKDMEKSEILELASLNHRWKQWLSGLRFLVALSREKIILNNESYQKSLFEMMEYHCSTLFSMIHIGIRAECPEAADILNISMYDQVASFLLEHGKKTEVDYSRAISVINKRKPKKPNLLEL